MSATSMMSTNGDLPDEFIRILLCVVLVCKANCAND